MPLIESAPIGVSGIASSLAFVRTHTSSNSGTGGQIWNQTLSAWEAFNPANIADYAIPVTERGSTGVYYAIDLSVAATHTDTRGRVILVRMTGAGPSLTEADILSRWEWEELYDWEQFANAATASFFSEAASSASSIILARLGSWTGTGMNTILGALRAIWNKTAGLTPSDLTDGITAGDQGASETSSLPAVVDAIEAGGGRPGSPFGSQ